MHFLVLQNRKRNSDNMKGTKQNIYLLYYKYDSSVPYSETQKSS